MIPESNIKDLMLRKDVLAAVSEGRFHVYAVSSIDQGIEILTGRPAGAKQADGTYPEESINGRVDRKLAQLAEGLKGFGDGGDKGERGREQGAGRQTDSACRESGA
jgi:predicted ATP-dependent protease